MNRRTFRRKPSDFKRILRSLTEEEEIAAKIIIAAVDAEETNRGIL
jgi:hypothetical protein